MNQKRGYVALPVNGDPVGLRYDVNAMCRIEDELAMPIAQILESLNGNGVSIKTIRTIFACGLVPAHGVDDAGAVMDEIGIADASEYIGKAFQLAFPEGKKEGKANPRKATAGQ